MKRSNFEKEDPAREFGLSSDPDSGPVVHRRWENGREIRELGRSGLAYSSPWLSVPLMALTLVCAQVAWAAASPCQGWGKATFVYAADTVEACLDADLDVNAGINRTGKTPLIGATQLGDSDAVWLLLAAGANPNKQDRQGWTALMFAAQAGHQDIVRQLAKADADPNIRNDAERTALLLALEQERTAVLGLLAAAGAAINAATLVWLVEQGQQSVIPALAAAGVNLDIRLAGGGTLLMVAAERGQQAMVEQLVAVGLDPNRAAQNGETALIRAAEAGHRDLVEYLLRFQSDTGAGALFWAGAHGRSSAVEQLLALGVDPNSRIDWKFDQSAEAQSCPQLDVAAWEDYTSFAQQLLAAGADPNRGCGSPPSPPLMTAISRDYAGVVEHLIGAGADVNYHGGYSGWTPLIEAAYRGHSAIVDHLIAAGADLNLQDNGGQTALMEMIGHLHYDDESAPGSTIAERLIAANADLSIRDKSGKTALDIAEARLASSVRTARDVDVRARERAVEHIRKLEPIVKALRAATPKTPKARKGWW